MYSDRGTNFRSAATVLTKELKQINEEAEDALARKGIVWEFNPLMLHTEVAYGKGWYRYLKSTLEESRKSILRLSATTYSTPSLLRLRAF